MCRKVVSTLDCVVNWLERFVAKSYKSSTITLQKDGFAGSESCQERGYAQISQCLRVNVSKSYTVLVTFGREYRVYQKYCNAHCGVTVGHRK